MHKYLGSLIVILTLVSLSSCLRRDFYAVNPLGDDHYLRMIVESTSGDSLIYRYNSAGRKFCPVKRLPFALEWNIGFLPPGQNGKNYIGDVIHVFLPGKPKYQGTILKIIPITTLSVSTEDGVKYFLLAVPADENERIFNALNLEELSIVEKDIFTKSENAVCELYNFTPNGLHWLDAHQTWQIIENYIKP